MGENTLRHFGNSNYFGEKIKWLGRGGGPRSYKEKELTNPRVHLTIKLICVTRVA